jgi:SAM-dependent methyltransferase
MASHICPWWAGPLLASPIRRLLQNPETILSPYLRGGMTILEIGPGMGFFTLPAARLVGPGGKIICVDIQEKMIAGLMRRARRVHLDDRITPVISTPSTYNLGPFTNQADCCLLIAMVHEVPDQEQLFREISPALKHGAIVLIAEPEGHVSAAEFETTAAAAAAYGMVLTEPVILRRHHAALFRKTG